MIKVGDQTVAWKEGLTVADLLREIGDDYPYGAVKIKDKFISRPTFDTTPVPDEVEVFLIPMIVGG